MAVAKEAARIDCSSANEDSAILPPDHGRGAWLFLAGCFWIEGLTWSKSKFGSFHEMDTVLYRCPLKTSAYGIPLGFPFSYGVFQKYYSTHEPFSSHPSGIASVGTTTLVSKCCIAAQPAVAF